jgi:gamma-glutamylcyclotransferase (GGCT)/AIG2-like uncharacterized protein YtfP
MKIAVYGTLRVGEVNHALMRSINAKLIETKMIDGVEIRVSKTIGFPVAVIKQGSEAVVEIYEIDERQIAVLDRLESYRPNDLDSSMYHRITLPTDSSVSIYVGNPMYWRKSNAKFKAVKDWTAFSREVNR